MCSRGMLVGLGQVDINLPCLVLSCLVLSVRGVETRAGAPHMVEVRGP